MTASEIDAPAQWLLDLGRDGVAITEKHALARAVVREAAERWPVWWQAELFGPPHREAELPMLAELRLGLLRLKLLRRRSRALHITPRGRDLAGDPVALAQVLVADLGGGDGFDGALGSALMHRLATGSPVELSELDVLATTEVIRGGWRLTGGAALSERDLSWAVLDLRCRAEGYGLIASQRGPNGLPSTIALTAAGRAALGFDWPSSRGVDALLFKTDLLGAKGVTARVAVRADQPMTALHDAIQEAFGWCDDHLYSFWLDNRFRGAQESEFISPVTEDHGVRTADVRLSELELVVGAKIAYVFDFGDEWRVRLTLLERSAADAATYPRVVARRGTAPPQYGD